MNSQISEIQTPKNITKLSRDLMKVSDHQLGTKFRSKNPQDQFKFKTFKKIVHKYLPPKDSVNKEFIKQILKNEKEVFDMNDVKQVRVPKFDELSVKNIYYQVQDDELVRKYLPDQDSKSKPIDRKFFFDILNTIYPDYLRQIIQHAQNIRNKPQDNEEKKEYILISDSWYEQLMSHPFISSMIIILFTLIFQKNQEKLFNYLRKVQSYIKLGKTKRKRSWELVQRGLKEQTIFKYKEMICKKKMTQVYLEKVSFQIMKLLWKRNLKEKDSISKQIRKIDMW